MARLILENVGKKYSRGIDALKNINLEIPDGGFTTILGPSGSGKSTLLRLIAGLETLSSGKIYIGDEDVSSLEPGKRKISMVFQGFALYPHMTVYENMAFSLKAERLPRAEIRKRIDEASAYLEIGDLLSRRPDTLSGGQKQRVAIGRAIVRRPRVFLFDEALSNLDEKLKESMRTLLVNMHKTLRTTMIYVTHDQKEALSLSDYVVLIKDGVLQQAGTPEEMYKAPANMFTATFIGTPQINLVPYDVLIEVFGCKDALKSLASCELNSETLEDITAAIRPEHFEVCDPGTPGAAAFTVKSFSYVGFGENLVVERDDVSLNAALRTGSHYELGSVVFLRPHLEKILLFNKKNELRL